MQKQEIIDVIYAHNNRMQLSMLHTIFPAHTALIDSMIYSETPELFMYPKTNEVTVAASHDVFHATEHSAGFDLRTTTTVTILPNTSVLVPLLLDFPSLNLVEVHPDAMMFLLPRSSTFNKFKLILANSVGLIDADYPNTVFANMLNLSQEPVTVPSGTYIAQGVLVHAIKGMFPTKMQPRTGGFGSTDQSEQ